MSDQSHCQGTSSNLEPARQTPNNSLNYDVLDAPDPTVGKEGLSSGGSIVTARDADSPLRIFVRCLSHKIPGRRADRATTMANIICQHHFQRDIDRDKEHITSRGLFEVDGKKVKFLLECGTDSSLVKVEDIPIVGFKWNGQKLVPRDVDTRTRAYLYTMPFKLKPPVPKAGKSKTIEQMRASMDDKAWDRYMGEVILRKLQFRKRATPVDRSWAKEHPDLFHDVIQQFTAQQRWYKLELSPSLKQWVEAQTDRADPNTFVDLIDVVLDNLGIDETDGEPPALRSATAGTPAVASPHP